MRWTSIPSKLSRNVTLRGLKILPPVFTPKSNVKIQNRIPTPTCQEYIERRCSKAVMCLWPIKTLQQESNNESLVVSPHRTNHLERWPSPSSSLAERDAILNTPGEAGEAVKKENVIRPVRGLRARQWIRDSSSEELTRAPRALSI